MTNSIDFITEFKLLASSVCNCCCECQFVWGFKVVGLCHDSEKWNYITAWHSFICNKYFICYHVICIFPLVHYIKSMLNGDLLLSCTWLTCIILYIHVLSELKQLWRMTFKLRLFSISLRDKHNTHNLYMWRLFMLYAGIEYDTAQHKMHMHQWLYLHTLTPYVNNMYITWNCCFK